MATRCYETQDVARTLRSPCICGKRPRRVSENLNGAEHLYSQVCYGLRRVASSSVHGSRLRSLRPSSARRQLLAHIRRQQFYDFRLSEEARVISDLTLEPVFVIITRRQIERASDLLKHLSFFSLLEIASGERDRCLSFVVIKSVLAEIFERGLKVCARSFVITLSK